MPVGYNGNASGITARETPAITVPVGTDDGTAASVNLMTEKLADYMAFLNTNVMLQNAANTLAAATAINHQLTLRGETGDVNAPLAVSLAPTNRKLIMPLESTGSGSQKTYIYMNNLGGLEIVGGAHWTGSAWTADSGVVEAARWYSMLVIGQSFGAYGAGTDSYTGMTVLGFNSASIFGWADTDWTPLQMLSGYPGLSYLGGERIAFKYVDNRFTTIALTNTLTAKAIIKAFARVTLGASPAVAAAEGLNVDSITYGADGLTAYVNTASQNVANAVVVGSADCASDTTLQFRPAFDVHTSVRVGFRLWSHSTGFVDMRTLTATDYVMIHVHGEQPS